MDENVKQDVPVAESAEKTSEPVKPQGKQVPFMVLVGILLIFLFAGGGLYFMTASNRKETKKVAPSPTVVATVTSTPTVSGPTQPADSRTYNLGIYEFSSPSPKQVATFTFGMGGSFAETDPVKRGNILYVSDSTTVYSHNLQTGEKKTVYKTNEKDRPIMSFQIDGNELYVTLEPSDYYSDSTTFDVQVVDIKTGKVLRTISKLEHVFYGGINYLFRANDVDVVASFGGDSCGGWGTISKVEKGVMKEVAETGAGCSTDPRYIGFVKENNQIILASLVPAPSGEFVPMESEFMDPLFGAEYNEIYAVHVLTGKKEVLFDLKTIPDVTEVVMDFDNKTLAIISEGKVSLVRIGEKSVSKTFTGTDFTAYSWEFVDGVLAGVERNQKNSYIIDTTTGQTTKQSWSSLNPVSNSPFFIGKVNNMYLHGVYTFNF